MPFGAITTPFIDHETGLLRERHQIESRLTQSRILVAWSAGFFGADLASTLSQQPSALVATVGFVYVVLLPTVALWRLGDVPRKLPSTES